MSTDLLSVSEFEIEVDEVSGKAHPNETESAHGEIETQVEHSKLVLDNGPVLWDLPFPTQKTDKEKMSWLDSPFFMSQSYKQSWLDRQVKNLFR